MRSRTRVFSQDAKRHYLKLNDDLISTSPHQFHAEVVGESRYSGARRIHGPFAQPQPAPTPKAKIVKLSSSAPPQATHTTGTPGSNADQESSSPARPKFGSVPAFGFGFSAAPNSQSTASSSSAPTPKATHTTATSSSNRAQESSSPSPPPCTSDAAFQFFPTPNSQNTASSSSAPSQTIHTTATAGSNPAWAFGSTGAPGSFTQTRVATPQSSQNIMSSASLQPSIHTNVTASSNTARDNNDSQPQSDDQLSKALVHDFMEIRTMMDELACRELPGEPPHAVLEYYIDLFLTPWRGYSQVCFEGGRGILSNHLNGLIMKHFGNLPTPLLRTRVR